ncbi:hypothetical protein [Cognatishimia sp. F0-27]|uniref:hypothetical protein n=1 Tax=Cognatishimia sp. F0-27 TaxID=2816855 RepID=UPI001D0C29E2|nr:hypothetical protein [Cognatishimia sp. F0-27]MCC1494263.1 hypothetical protein [Cognatishimia sp. F0-27]
MTRIEIRINEDDPLCRALQTVADRKGQDLEDVLREYLSQLVERSLDDAWAATQAPGAAADEATGVEGGGPPDARRLADEGLREQVRRDLESAQSWPELQGRLMLRGCALRSGSTGLEVVQHPGEDRLWSLDSLGLSRAALERRIGARFPDSSGIDWARLRGQGARVAPIARPGHRLSALSVQRGPVEDMVEDAGAKMCFMRDAGATARGALARVAAREADKGGMPSGDGGVHAGDEAPRVLGDPAPAKRMVQTDAGADGRRDESPRLTFSARASASAKALEADATGGGSETAIFQQKEAGDAGPPLFSSPRRHVAG